MAAVLEAAVHRLHEGPVILQTHVLEHADGDDLVIGAVEIAVIPFDDLHGEPLARFAGVFDLPVRYIDGGHTASAFFGHVSRQAAPAAADVEHAVVRLEVELAADEVHLFHLGLVQVVRPVEVGATILVVRIKKGHEEVVVQVVVPLGDVERPHPRLHVQEDGRDGREKELQAPDDLFVDAGGEHLVDQLVQPLAVPPPLHVCLAEPQILVAEKPGIKPLVPDPDVRRTAAVDPDARRGKHPLEYVFLTVHRATLPSLPMAVPAAVETDSSREYA